MLILVNSTREHYGATYPTIFGANDGLLLSYNGGRARPATGSKRKEVIAEREQWLESGETEQLLPSLSVMSEALPCM